MRTTHTLLAVLLSFLIGSAHALTAPVLNVDRTVPSAVGITKGMVDFAPFATTSFTYVITNSGNMPLAIHAPTLSNIVGATVTITGVPASPIAAAGTANLVISLTPTGSTGNWSFKVNIGSTDLSNNPFSWTVKNGTPQPDISVTYDQVNVIDDESAANTIEVGQADIIAIPYTLYPFVVSNTGSAPLRITSFSFPTGTGDQEGVDVIQLFPVPIFPLFIAPGSSRTFNIAVLATGGLEINWSAKVSIRNDDGTNLPTGGLPLGPERDYRFRIGSTYEAQTAFSGAYGKGEVRVLSPTGIICLNRGVARTAPGTSQVGVPSNQTLFIQNPSLVDTVRLIVPLVGTVPTRTFGPCVTVVPKGPLSPGPINATATVTVQPTGGLPFTDDVTKGYFELPIWPGPPLGFPTAAFTVQVTPLKEGNWSVPVTFSNNDTDGEEPYTITLTGFAVGVPDMSIANRGTTLIASGTIATGIPSATTFVNLHSFVVTNTGTGTLLLDNTLIDSGLVNCALVGVPATTATAVGPGGRATFTIRTQPIVAGAWSASFSLTSSDPAPSPFTVTVSGDTTLPPPFREMDIFNVLVPVPNGGTATANTSIFPQTTAYSITMQNSGTLDLNVTSATVGAVTNCTATITAPATFPTIIAALDPSTSLPLVVNVTPIAEGPWTVALTVNSNDADEGVYTFTLSGTARKIKPQDPCGIGSGFSLLLLVLIGAVLPLVIRRR